jgi:hypothetical protein
MKADIYYPQVEQNMYGQITKDWSIDRTILGSFIQDKLSKEDLPTDSYVHPKDRLTGRVQVDIRKSSAGENHALSNILVVNIRNAYDDLIYFETSGEREGRGTIFEIVAFDPFVGPFGNIEYYNVILRRTENQGVED